MFHVEVNCVERRVDFPDPLDGGISTFHRLVKLRHLRHGFVADNADEAQQSRGSITGLLPGQENTERVIRQDHNEILRAQ